MPPIIYSCTPQCKFWFNRGYLRGVQVADYETGISWAVNVATVTLTVPFVYHHIFVFNPILWAWNSNVYSLDFILDDMYYLLPNDPTHYQTPVTLEFLADLVGQSPYIRVGIPFAPFNLPYHPVPPSPSGWWSG